MNKPVKDKNMEKSETSKLVSLLIVLLSLAAGLGGTWALFGEGIDSNTESIKVLKTEGSKLAVQNKYDIVMIKKDLTSIQESQKEMKAEQKKGFDAILDRLPEKD